MSAAWLTRPLFCRATWWRMAVLLAGWGAGAGCETPPPRLPAASKPVPARVVRAAPDTRPPTAAQRGYHRYRGTLGGRPVQLEFTVVAPTLPASYAAGGAEVVESRFRYRDSGQALDIGPLYGFSPHQPLEIRGWVDQLALLCTDQPVGALLTGTYTLGRRQMPFRVQEDYSDCLRYEVLHEATAGPPEAHGEDTLWASVSRDYVHLLGTDTLRPAWARLQCPSPARRQQARAARVRRISSGVQNNLFLSIWLNEASLFAYEVEEREESAGSRYYEARIHQVLYDLRTGRELDIMGQLRPGGRRRLHQLLTRQALADTANVLQRNFWWQGGTLPLPDRGFAVTPEGLVASYLEHESEPQIHAYAQTITWATLRPLLRPRTPLRRLLKTNNRPLTP